MQVGLFGIRHPLHTQPNNRRGKGHHGREDELIKRENRREFLRKISKDLSSFEFKVTVMYMDGLTMAEISSATGKPVKSIDNALQRAKRKLFKLFN